MPIRNHTYTLVAVITLLNIGKYTTLNILFPYAGSLGMKAYEFGVFSMVYSLFQILSIPLFGALSYRIGKKKVLMICLAGTALSYLLTCIAHNLLLIVLARCVDGITGANIVMTNAMLSESTDQKQRLNAFTYVHVSYGASLLAAPVLGGLIALYSMKAVFAFAFLLSIGSLLACWFFVEAPPATVVARSSWKVGKAFLRHRSFLLLMTVVLLVTAAQFCFNIVYQSYAYTFLKLTILQVSLTSGALALTGILVQLFSKKRLNDFGSMKKILGFGLLAGALSMLVIAGRNSYPIFLMACLVYIAFYALRYPVLSLMVSVAAKSDVALGFSINQVIITVGSFLGSLVASAGIYYLPAYSSISVAVLLIACFFFLTSMQIDFYEKE